MNNQPMFSIIIPIFESKKYLKKTVASIQKQTFSDIEIILVDDGSTDGSDIICDKLASEDSRINVIHQKNMGASNARNVGIEASRGKWLIFVDSDDIVSKVMCETFYYHILQKMSQDFLACSITRQYDKLAQKVNDSVVLELRGLDQNISLIKQMLLGNYSYFSSEFRRSFGSNVILNSPCAKAYRKKFIIEKNLKFESKVMYSEDLLFNIKFLANGAKGEFIESKVYFYRNNLKSVSNRKYVPNLICNYVRFKQEVKKIILKKRFFVLSPILDAYVFRESLGVVSMDIFQPKNSVLASYKRMKQINASPDFKKICNLDVLKKRRKIFNFKTKVKGYLLLKKHFMALYILYKLK